MTLRELKDDYDWDKVCEVFDLNPYCLNEGMHEDVTIEMNKEQAVKVGIITVKGG